MNSYLFMILALLVGLVLVGIALAINYQRYKRVNSRMLEQLQKIEQDWQTEFAKTPLSELNETHAGKQLLALEGISEEAASSQLGFTKIGDRILYKGMEIELNPISHRILALLIEHGGEAVTTEEIAREVFESTNTVSGAALSEAMRRLKEELRFAQQAKELILFIPEQGFVLQVTEENE